jgi:hypothetical protein
MCDVRLQFNSYLTVIEPPRLVIVPGNGPAPQDRAELEVVARDMAGIPLYPARVFVLFDPASTASLCWCPAQNQAWMVLGSGERVFYADTDPSGFAEFQISAGGCYSGAAVEIRVGPVGLADPRQAFPIRMPYAVSSFDNTGQGGAPCDGMVDARDLARYAACHVGGPGAYSPCFDYNGDGAVDAVDFQLYAQHHLRFARC